MAEPVLVVQTCWKRPANTRRQVEHLRSQSWPLRVVIVDNSPDDQEPLGVKRDDMVVDIYRVHQNLGPPCRFLPAYSLHDYKYVWWLDDDFLPRPRALEHLVATAEKLDGKFSTISQKGRRFERAPVHPKWEGKDWLYVQRNIKREEEPVPVDMTVRAHFVRADLIHHALSFKWELLSTFGESAVRPAIDIHDDILLCVGISKATGYPCYLTPTGPMDTLILGKDLPDDHAVSERLPHHMERTELINYAAQVGARYYDKMLHTPQK